MTVPANILNGMTLATAKRITAAVKWFEEEPTTRLRHRGRYPVLGGNKRTSPNDSLCPCCPDCSCCPTDATLYTDACSPFTKLYKNYKISGHAPYGGHTLVWSSGCIFYTPSFNTTICGTDYGSHRWKWTAAEPIDTSVLELEGVGSGYSDLVLRYKNKWHLDPWCGNDFGIIERWTFPCAVAHDPPKVLCISPSAALCPPCPNIQLDCCTNDSMPVTTTLTLLSGPNAGATASCGYVGIISAYHTWQGTMNIAAGCSSLNVTIQYVGSCKFTITITDSVTGNVCSGGAINYGSGTPWPCPFSYAETSFTPWTGLAGCVCDVGGPNPTFSLGS